MAIKLLAQDKANHALIGACAAAVAAHLAPLFGVDRRAGAMLGAAAAGLAIEAVQAVLNWRARRAGLTQPHDVSGADFLATAMGGLPVAMAAGG